MPLLPSNLLVSPDNFIEQQGQTSYNNKNGARKALKHWDNFLAQSGNTGGEIIKELKALGQKPEFYLFLNQFIQYLNANDLSPNSVRAYLSFVKGFLRANGLRIYNEDMKQFVKLPKIIKESKAPLSMKTIAKLYRYSDPYMKAVLSSLVSSGMRASELLQLEWKDIKAQTVKIRAETTKTKADRETFLSKQALKDLAKIKTSSSFVLGSKYIPDVSLVRLEGKFSQLRSKSHEEKRYRLSIIHHVTLHRLRAFCKTVVSNKLGKDYAEKLIGHEGYLSTYYAPDDMRKNYDEIEKNLTIPEGS